MIVNISQKQGELLISYIKADGQIGFNKIAIPSTYQYQYVYANNRNNIDDTKTSWDFKPVKKVPARFLSNARIQEFFLDVGDEKMGHLFANNTPQIAASDIEVYVDDNGFSSPEEARTPITSISFSKFPYITVFGSKPLSTEQINTIQQNINDHIKPLKKSYIFVYKYHKNEADLLYDYLYNYVRLAPLVTGWNFWGYDWRYILNRCKKLNIDISWLSPTKEWYTHKIADRNEKVIIDLPMHKLIVDHMFIYQKWDRTVEVKENDTLDYVMEEVLKIKKVHYPGTLQELYEKNYENYIFYNAIDSIGVEQIHYKIKTINTFLGLANVTRVEAMTAFSPIAMLESVLARYAYMHNKVFPKYDNDNVRQSYEGAFVFEPIPNMYEWVASFDFASLYPSIMRQFKISIENYLGKDKNKEVSDKEIKTYTGAIFDNTYEPIISEILTAYYGLRKQAKSVSLQAEEKQSQLKEIYQKRFGVHLYDEDK